jgi:small-conductance mechanosensitive channel
MKPIYRRIFALIPFLLGTTIWGQQLQDTLVSPKGDTVIIKPVPLLEISPKIGEFNTNLKLYNEKLKTIEKVYEIDTSAINAEEFLNNEKTKIIESLDELTLVNIENEAREWRHYETILKNWESLIKDRITEIETAIFELQIVKRTWDITRQSSKKLEIPRESLTRINEVIASDNQLIKRLKSKQDSVIIIQNKITDFQIVVDEVLTLLEEARKDIQSNYFKQDSPPIWFAGDSTIKVSNAKAQFRNSLNDHTASINRFVNDRFSTLLWQLFLFILLLILFYYLHLDIKKHDLPEGKQTDRIHYFLSRYILSSLLLALSFSLIFYPNIPSAARELMFIIYLIPTVLLYIKIIPKSMGPLFFYLILIFFLDEIHFFYPTTTLLTRIMMIIQDTFFIWIMINIVKPRSPTRAVYEGNWLKAIISGGNLLIVIAVISIISNIIGYVNLSGILSNTMINAILVPIVLSLLVSILIAFFTGLFKTKFFQYSNIVKAYETILIRKIHTLLIYLALFIWIRSILRSIGIAGQVGDWILGLLKTTWGIGSVTISVGGIFGFFLVILITSIVTRGIKYILEDEIFPRIKLGRGVPGAISMVIRYTLVAFGIYVALSAAGVDLGQFGLIAGALGVGIGFGLQGIVYNFIAGLILAFERPIQKGDTIEIGTLFGDVKNIGVRASTIRTYDGSEVIVPNGNLISNEVINWTLTDRVRRREVKVGVAYGSDPHKVMELLFNVASENEHVIPYPKPWPLFEGFGDSSLNFRILFWVNFDQGLTIQSEVAMAIYDALDEAGIQIPFPQTDLHVKSFDPTVQKTIFPFSKEQLKKTPGRIPRKPKKDEDKQE